MTTTSTSPTATFADFSADDPRATFGRAHATAAGVIAGVEADQLEHRTPCDDFDVRTLLGHLLAVAQRVANVGRGESPFSVGETVEGVADADWATTWAAVGDEVAEAWADDATLDRVVELPWATLPGSATLIMWCNELSVHTWDLAAATGQPVDWDESVLAPAFAGIQMGLPDEGRIEAFEAARAQMPDGEENFSYPFKAAVHLPEDAPLIDRLVAWNGREPR
jgi:uncharacterized protein (TIGR03086 family)